MRQFVNEMIKKNPKKYLEMSIIYRYFATQSTFVWKPINT